MIHAYDEQYLLGAKKRLSIVVDYLAYDCECSDKEIEKILGKSKYLKMFAEGNPLYLAGMSGVELAKLVASEFLDANKLTKYEPSLEKSPEYWAGWVLAAYSWYSFKDLERILYAVSFTEILKMYPVYHEMDINRFYEAMDEKVKRGTVETNLKTIRQLRELSQSQLSKLSGVSLRSIQLYEQKVNDIDKAQVQTLYKLSKVLDCPIEKLLENPQNDF